MAGSYTRKQLEAWLGKIDVKVDNVIDIGGSQFPIKDRTKSWDVKDYKILDLEKPHEGGKKPDIIDDLNKSLTIDIKYNACPICGAPAWDNPFACSDNCQSNGGEFNGLGSAYQSIIKHKKSFKYTKEYFDVAFCIEVSEYLYNPFQALKNINEFLKPNGILYISFHFLYPVHNPVNCDYLRYTPNGAIKLLEETGFKVEEIVPRLGKWNIKMDDMRPAKKYDKHDWVGCCMMARKNDSQN